MRFSEWESPDARPERPLPKPVSALVAGMASKKGWEQRLRGARVHALWSEIAGDELARHVQPVRLVGGVLLVRVESAAWATQVTYLAGQLRDRANAVLGQGEVRSVTVQTGGAQHRT